MIDTAYILAGALTGVVGGLTGVGGGALMTPILLIFFWCVTNHGHCNRFVVCRHYQAVWSRSASHKRKRRLAGRETSVAR